MKPAILLIHKHLTSANCYSCATLISQKGLCVQRSWKRSTDSSTSPSSDIVGIVLAKFVEVEERKERNLVTENIAISELNEFEIEVWK